MTTVCSTDLPDPETRLGEIMSGAGRCQIHDLMASGQESTDLAVEDPGVLGIVDDRRHDDAHLEPSEPIYVVAVERPAGVENGPSPVEDVRFHHLAMRLEHND